MLKATFYFDLGSPFAYLAAERVEELLGDAVHWQPVSLGALFKLNGRSSWALAGEESRRAGIAEIERRASLYGLAPLRWPEPWPGNYLMAMRAAVFAYRAKRGREFTLTAFRAGFKEGRDLSLPENVLRCAEDAGLDPHETRDATGDPEIKLVLRHATDTAHSLGVFGVPTIAVGDHLFWGEDRLADAASALEQHAG
jgi:2-hydroxychromene-2-carboxylate isomerase